MWQVQPGGQSWGLEQAATWCSGVWMRTAGTNKGTQSCISILKVKQSFKTQQSLEVPSWIFCGIVCSERWDVAEQDQTGMRPWRKLYHKKRIKTMQSWSDVNHFSNPYTRLSHTYFFSWIACQSCCLCGSHALSSPAQTFSCPLARCFCSCIAHSSWMCKRGHSTTKQHTGCCACGGTFIHLWA